MKGWHSITKRAYIWDEAHPKTRLSRLSLSHSWVNSEHSMEGLRRLSVRDFIEALCNNPSTIPTFHNTYCVASVHSFSFFSFPPPILSWSWGLRSLLQSVFQYTGHLLLNGCLPSSLSPSFGLAYKLSTPSCLSFYLVLWMLSPNRGLSYSLSNDLPPPSEFWP